MGDAKPFPIVLLTKYAIIGLAFLRFDFAEIERIMRGMDNKEKLQQVYEALQKNGYQPLSQLVGFLLTGDPTYITNSDGARKLVAGLDVDAMLHEIVQTYFDETE